jgi:hypothetical protein
MRDTLLAIATDAKNIIEHLGRKDVADILQRRIDNLMGWNHGQR